MTNKMPVVGKRYRATKHRNYIILVSDVNHNYISYIHDLGKDDYSMVHAMLIDEFWGEFEELPNSNLQKPEEVQVDLEKKEVNEVERALKELKEELADNPFQIRGYVSEACINWKGWYNILNKKAQALVNALESEKDRCNNTCITPVVDLSKPEEAQNLINVLEADKDTPKEHYDLGAVTRLEVIDDNGRSYVNLQANLLEFSYQDGGKTLKIFCSKNQDMSKPEPQIDMKEERVDPVSIWKDINKLQRLPFDYARKISINQNGYFGIRSDNESYIGDEKFCTLSDFINAFEQMQKDIEELKKKSI